MGNSDNPTDRQDLEKPLDKPIEIKVQEIDETLNKPTDPIRVTTDYIVLPITFWLATTSAQTAANYPPVLNVGFPMTILFAYESHGTANGGAATIQVDKLTTGLSQGSGVNMLATGIDINTTADTPIKYLPTSTLANRQLIAGDRVEIRQPTGSLTSVRDVCVTLFFKVNLKDLPK